MDRKTLGYNVLKTVMKKERNIIGFQRCISNACKTDDEYRDILFEVVGDILCNRRKLTDVIKTVKKRKIGWNNDVYKGVRDRLDEHDEFIVTPFEVIESILECGKCKSKKTFSYSKQCRSSDEPATLFVTCAICGNNWSQSA